MSSPAPARPEPRILGLALAVGAIVMVLGVAGGALALVKLEFGAAGICLFAAGATAGLLANAVLRS